MKKILIKAFVLTVMIFFTIFAVIYLQPVDKDKYLGAIIDKHKLLKVTEQPRIILVGDSNLAFGIDSTIIKKETGFNVINMGLHGGLGYIYNMDEVKPYLKKDDVVILIFDYLNYLSDGLGTHTIVELTIFYPEAVKYYSKKNMYRFVTNIPMAFQRRFSGLFFKHKDDIAFSRKGFNEHGDNVGHIGLPQPHFKTLEGIQRPLPQSVDGPFVQEFNAFYDEFTAKGVLIFSSFSPLMINNQEQQKKELKALLADMNKKLKIPIIGKPWNFMYPRELFFDNEFHLNGKGRDLRTKELVRAMKEIPLFKSKGKKQ